ncbi:MAG: cysteine--tRNA ligase [Oscillospiraceae bacterium]|jgi:cysteinyl-tRNA synthetase|nr:cysteine--tRNA ligase [Oscillospiraceae bacterium]
MKLYNTLTRRKETFEPLEPGKVKMYNCGSTVYNLFHVGNARTFVISDVLRRYLKYIGYAVTFAQNFTDIDDKIIRKAAEERLTAAAVAEKYIAEYLTDAEGLNLRPADIHPRATESVPAIIAMISTLVSKGNAYESNGDVYFDVHSFKDYGKLSGQDIASLESGVRVESDDRKRSAGDFALWKRAKPGEPAWDSPWGAGRPGWHIECSAMCSHHLGETIDIHCGGSDLIFPHHENEIAQSESASGVSFARFWLHVGMLNVGDRKMGKSEGNFFMVRTAAEAYGYEAIRFFLLSAHYRSPFNYTEESLRQSTAALDRLYSTLDNLTFIANNAEPHPATESELESLSRYRARFIEAMDDDLNTADAISVLFDLARDLNARQSLTGEFAKSSVELLRELTDVLGLLYGRDSDGGAELAAEVERLIERRRDARQRKDFAESDRIRDELKAMGIALQDTPLGIKWSKI